MKDFADSKRLKVLVALYNLTIYEEDAYAGVEEIVKESGLSRTLVENCLEEISTYILERADGEKRVYRIGGMYERLVPLLAMLSITA